MNAPARISFPQALGMETSGIRRVAVIGAGSMGSGIAAQFANAGILVDLLDVPGHENRNGPAEGGVARQVKAGGFMGAECPTLVRTGNVSDHLHRLAEADWIVEAVIEDLAIKRDLYRRIETIRRPGTIVSSNTSTIPRAELVEGLRDDFARDFIITHFFNPPRVMQLVEIVSAPENRADLVKRAVTASEAVLGKTVVMCRDTPGFIANRIGCYWIAVGICEAMRLGLSVEEADAVNAAFGIPRTGVFGLLDLIGIDLVPHVWGSLMRMLPVTDDIHTFDLPANPLVRTMIAGGRHGRKTSQGFYRKTKDGSREVLDLTSSTYRPEASVARDALPGGGDLAALLADDGKLGTYAFSVLSHVVAYAAQHGSELAADVAAIDTAIALGYSWREGPFRLADRAGINTLVKRMAAAGKPVPPLLTGIEAQNGFYDRGPLLTTGAGRASLKAPSLLSEAAVIAGNTGARLRDIGDGVACFEVTTKMGTLGPDAFDMLEDTLARAGQDYQALVIGNEDARAFSAGADLSFILRLIDGDGLEALRSYIGRGQELFLAMKYLPVPVIAAAHGFALGGGCELMLHADAIVAHAELNAGLPEMKVGLIPAWGGCTQLLLRAQEGESAKGPVASATRAFETIQSAGMSGSALQAREMGLLRNTDGIVMHRSHLIPAAKSRALAMVEEGYSPPERALLTAAGPSGRLGLLAPVSAAVQAGRLSATDDVIAGMLASVLVGGSGGDPTRLMTEADVMRLERETLVALAKMPTTRVRMEHMRKTGKPLKD
ncbi:3-hydroxyacyl-CoA dehydrogenase/enoyl-CoA hydratase family protein [Microvirga puerhi]|uniref:3-hydroxyacyl-CoA dehydrogenase/enoyl-CoA hydratase family protein n=1 Tax=Microvirga puerhi TaxID=2876078 RepID=A0ABS7VUB7_9HYPH|nr:3-hydroxyacyl-CoA dehydrogenase/enoyl-CoA hydratase family protein [Microvirga puerhi]MBZ6078492.1 3-hydroxyacyl-CoA dehydrogenase/enoyl-CoA hydratase family protein [Microvirga puerhi]